MIDMLDKVIYGLGALTLVGVALCTIGISLFLLAGITMGIVDSIKNISNKKQKDDKNG